MSKINKIDLHLLRNGEHYQFMYELQYSIISYTPDVLGITEVYPLFDSTLAKEELALRVEHGSNKTKTIKGYDKKRMQIWRSVKHRIKSAVLSPISEETESGKVLQRIFKKYGNLYRESVSGRSTLIRKLAEEFLSAANANHLQVVNLTKLIPELEKENHNYIDGESERTHELAARTSRNVGRIRKDLDPIYNKMSEIINSTLILNIAQPAVMKFVNELNTRIKTYKTIIVKRRAHNKRIREAKIKDSGEEEVTQNINLSEPNPEKELKQENPEFVHLPPQKLD